MRRFLKKLMSGLLAIAMVLPTFVGGAPVKGAETKAVRTFLLYVCGTDNETNIIMKDHEMGNYIKKGGDHE